MSQRDDILDIVAKVSMVDRDKLAADARVADLGITSMDMVEIICEIEDKFNIALPYNANMNFKTFPTFGDVMAMLDETIAIAGK